METLRQIIMKFQNIEEKEKHLKATGEEKKTTAIRNESQISRNSLQQHLLTDDIRMMALIFKRKTTLNLEFHS